MKYSILEKFICKSYFVEYKYLLLLGVVMSLMLSVVYGGWSSVSEIKARGETGGHVVEIGYSSDKGSPVSIVARWEYGGGVVFEAESYVF